ncbi:MAG: Dihydroorotate dehydrogenase [Parcubacteria group bacterium GW2011_GWB1_55_9]|nr:MAG: Dihydroorotate dehydrogenase [Parcubacteria group bacterium GW2011_GWB1_55_9]
MFYTRVLKPIFFLCGPESMHNFMVFSGEVFGALPPVRQLLSLAWGYHGKDISKVVDGVRYERPVLLSAGFDTDGRLSRVLSCISFGGEEVGSVTSRPCAGNARPRLLRLIRNKSLVVWKGLRNQGARAIAKRLANTQTPHGFVVGISIAQTNDEKVNNAEAGIEDYYQTFVTMTEAGVGDYYTINISCPNTFGGETFTTPELLTRLLTKLAAVPCEKPRYIKMPINLAWDDFSALLKVIDAFGYNGVVISNLNKQYSMLDFPQDAPTPWRGGLSGKPCFELSNECIRRTREAYGKRFTIIGVGGIFSPEDALAKFHAGADLVQLITGMVFEGPGLIGRICDAYARSSFSEVSPREVRRGGRT